MIYIGLDPGKAGFFTLFDGEGEYTFIKMPTHKVGDKTVFHIGGLKKVVDDIKALYPSEEFLAYVEEVGGRGGWSATNNFNFGYTAGLQMMVLVMLDAEVVMVRPQKWQAEMRKGYKNIKKSSSTGKTLVNDAKAMAEHIVVTEWPDIDFRKSLRARKNDDNKIDSFLVCMYGFRTHNK